MVDMFPYLMKIVNLSYSKKYLFFTLLLLPLLFPLNPYVLEGGNITELNISSNNSTSIYWAGIYGELINTGFYSNLTSNFSSNTIRSLDLNYSLSPGCNLLSLAVIASNSSIVPPLKPGNLTLLDDIINSSENASLTFTNTGNLKTSYGLILNVPYTYTNPSSSMFKTYYLNDNNNNIIFYSPASFDSPDWNLTTSDYQMILLSNTSFIITIDKTEQCNISNGGSTKRHILYIEKIGTITTYVGTNIKIPVNVFNNGDFTEFNVYLKSDYPTTMFFAFYDKIFKNKNKTAVLSLTPNETGTFIVKITAYSDKARYEREFTLIVKEFKCNSDLECGEGYYCNNGVCEEKKDFCFSDSDCSSNEKCIGNSCIPIPCDCGEIVNRTCIPYECCSNSDCSPSQICSSNICVDIKPTLDYNSTPIVGENITAFVKDQNGNPFDGLLIAGGKEYRIENGIVVFEVPENMLVYVVKANNKYGFFIPAKRRAYIRLTPFPVLINLTTFGEVVDAKGNPIGEVKVELYKEKKLIKVFYTYADSKFEFVVLEKKNYTLKAYSDDYYIPEKKFVPQEQSELYKLCLLPLILILLIALSYLLLKRRKKKRKKHKT